MSLETVAERAGLTKGFLSRVERDATSPSVTSLLNICSALGLQPSHLFATPKAEVTRASDRATTALPGVAVRDTLLTATDERKLTVLETIAPPGGSGGVELYSLPCETEVCYVVEGEVVVSLDTEDITLLAGDALTFDGTVPHTWRSCSRDNDARIIWILAPGLPDPLSHGVAPT